MNDEEDRTERDISRGVKAEALRDVLAESYDYLDAQYIKQWRLAKTMADREFWWQRIAALSHVRDHLNTVISNGRLAQVDLNVRIMRRRA